MYSPIEVGQVREVTECTGILACPEPNTYLVLEQGTKLLINRYGYECYHDLSPYYPLQRYEGEMAVLVTDSEGKQYEVSNIVLYNGSRSL